MQMCRDKFSIWSYYDDARLDKGFPAPKKETTRYFIKEQEPDKETLGLSVNEFEKKYPKENGITLRERLLLELAYFDETGEHLDVKGITFCSGSRFSNGLVPGVFLNNDEVRVLWYYLGRSSSDYGVRSCIDIENKVQSDNENDTNKQGFNITCERCGLCVHIKS